MSRALSVHQGKGATAADARLGALLEAVESNAAELFADHALTCSFDQLPDRRRASLIEDFADDRTMPPLREDQVGWCEGEPVPGLENILLPLPLVGLDLTAGPTRFDRSSNGVASGASRDEALLVALHELVERDSLVEWTALDMVERMATALDPQSLLFDWYHDLDRRIAAAGASLESYWVPSITGTPVFACEINDSSKSALPFRAIVGHAAHPLPEIALFKAVAEACQSRAAFISGARDDLFPWLYSQPETAIIVAFGLPLPPGMSGVGFGSVAEGPDSVASLCAALASAGCRQGAAVTLAQPSGLCVVRAFVCGLGSIVRRRRRPLQ